MAKSVQGVQGTILRWARESQGFSLGDVAKLMKKSPELIEAWEDDLAEAGPTYVQLEALAYKYYKRPLATFFLPKPPEEADVKKEFRTLPGEDIDHLSADTRYHIRLARAFQLSLNDLTDGKNQAENKIFRDITLSAGSDVAQSAEAIRRYLGISLPSQVRWTSAEEALKHWRSAIEDAGVFVFKNSFKQRAVSAFCLSDPEFPIIYLNNSSAKTRQSFSLFHELAHLLLSMNSISKFDQSYVRNLPDAAQRIEQFCNSLAAETLIPSDDFSNQVRSNGTFDDDRVQSLADRYLVSREAVLRRLLDRGLVAQSHYEMKSKQWAEEAMAARPPGSGGSFYNNRASYLGNAYMRLVFQQYYQGRINVDQVAEHLGVTTSQVAHFEERAVSSVSP